MGERKQVPSGREVLRDIVVGSWSGRQSLVFQISVFGFLIRKRKHDNLPATSHFQTMTWKIMVCGSLETLTGRVRRHSL